LISLIIVSGCSKVSSPTAENGRRTTEWFVEKYGAVDTRGLRELLTKVQARLRVASATIAGKDPGELRIRVFDYREPLANSVLSYPMSWLTFF
jgi:hypothetical protein